MCFNATPPPLLPKKERRCHIVSHKKNAEQSKQTHTKKNKIKKKNKKKPTTNKQTNKQKPEILHWTYTTQIGLTSLNGLPIYSPQGNKANSSLSLLRKIK